MTLNAAAEAARLSIAPMMDGGDSDAISIACVVLCAAHVHVSIALCRVDFGQGQ